MPSRCGRRRWPAATRGRCRPRSFAIGVGVMSLPLSFVAWEGGAPWIAGGVALLAVVLAATLLSRRVHGWVLERLTSRRRKRFDRDVRQGASIEAPATGARSARRIPEDYFVRPWRYPAPADLKHEWE